MGNGFGNGNGLKDSAWVESIRTARKSVIQYVTLALLGGMFAVPMLLWDWGTELKADADAQIEELRVDLLVKINKLEEHGRVDADAIAENLRFIHEFRDELKRKLEEQQKFMDRFYKEFMEFRDKGERFSADQAESMFKALSKEIQIAIDRADQLLKEFTAKLEITELRMTTALVELKAGIPPPEVKAADKDHSERLTRLETLLEQRYPDEFRFKKQ